MTAPASRRCAAPTCWWRAPTPRRCRRASTGPRISRAARSQTADGRELGVVARLRPLPSCEALEVGDLLVPMVGDAVLSVDIEAQRIVVDPGFLGLESS